MRADVEIKDRVSARVYQALASSDAVVRSALRTRIAIDRLIGTRLAPSTLAELNGEADFARAVGDRVRVAVDVGANIGEWSSLALARFPNLQQLIAYEPGQVATQFRANIQDPRVTLVQNAVSDERGDVLFHEAVDSHLSSAVSVEEGEVRGTRSVTAVRLDDELDRLEVPQVDFLKIDVEGFDLRVLRGANHALDTHRISVIQFEYNEVWVKGGNTLHEAHQLLEAAGYRNFAITGDGLRSLPDGGVPELFRYANFAALLPSIVDSLPDHITPIW